MSDRVFLDTNVIVYCYSNSEFEKQNRARNLIINNQTFISTQVLNELCNVITKRFQQTYTAAINLVEECISNNQLYINTETTILKACTIAERYKYSYYDSLIIASALSCDCKILYSEDMNHQQVIENRLTILNPFKSPDILSDPA